MPYFVELLRVDTANATRTFTRLRLAHETPEKAQAHAEELLRSPNMGLGTNTFQIVDGNGDPVTPSPPSRADGAPTKGIGQG